MTVKVPAASEGDSSLAEWDTVTSLLGDDGVAGRAVCKHRSHQRHKLGLAQTFPAWARHFDGRLDAHTRVHIFVFPASHFRAAGEKNTLGIGRGIWPWPSSWNTGWVWRGCKHKDLPSLEVRHR